MRGPLERAALERIQAGKIRNPRDLQNGDHARALRLRAVELARLAESGNGAARADSASRASRAVGAERVEEARREEKESGPRK
jgi:hypothetical protein